MSQDKNKTNLRSIAPDLPNIEVVPHPPDILELDEETVAIARAKLAGLDFDEIYGDEDRSSPNLMIKTQATKIRELFQSPSELRTAFSSQQNREQVKKDMIIDGIDLEFIKHYCRLRQISFRNDAEALIAVGFEEAPK